MAGKMDALVNPAAARDFLDIDAAIACGRYTIDQLCNIGGASQICGGSDLQGPARTPLGSWNHDESVIPRSCGGGRFVLGRRGRCRWSRFGRVVLFEWFEARR